MGHVFAYEISPPVGHNVKEAKVYKEIQQESLPEKDIILCGHKKRRAVFSFPINGSEKTAPRLSRFDFYNSLNDQTSNNYSYC